MSLTTEHASTAENRSEALSLDRSFEPVTVDQWKVLAERSLGDNGSIDALARYSLDGMKVSPLYFDRPASVHTGRIESASPIHWDNRLSILGEDPARCQEHLTAGLDGGIHSFRLDLTTLGLSGKASMQSALESILDGVYLDLAPVHLIAGESFVEATEALISLFEQRDYDRALLTGSIGADPFSDTLSREATSLQYEQSLETMAQLVKTHHAAYPGLQYAHIDLVAHHDAGATPVQEIVAGIALAADYMDALLDAGVSLDAALNALTFNVACDADLVSNVVKLRSLKRLWEHAVAQLQEGKQQNHCAGLNVVTRIDAHTSHRMLSRLDPWVNHLRNVTATSAAAIVGTDSITVHPHDLIDGHRIGEDAELADRVARNLPIILAEESLLKSVVDPTAGSYAIEHMTTTMSALAWKELGTLQSQGGLLAAVASGEWARSLAESHRKRVQRLIDSDDLMVGVNHQRPSDAPAIDRDAVVLANDADAGVKDAVLPRVRESSPFERGFA